MSMTKDESLALVADALDSINVLRRAHKLDELDTMPKGYIGGAGGECPTQAALKDCGVGCVNSQDLVFGALGDAAVASQHWRMPIHFYDPAESTAWPVYIQTPARLGQFINAFDSKMLHHEVMAEIALPRLEDFVLPPPEPKPELPIAKLLAAAEAAHKLAELLTDLAEAQT